MTTLLGCDFSSAPSKRKPNVLAWGQLRQGVVTLTRFELCASLDDTQAALCGEQAWVGGFDLPFGLPRELVQTLGWPTSWPALMAHYQSLSRADIREAFAGFCNARPVGGKFAHRATDLPAGSSPSMKWVNPPVAYMLHAGVALLQRVGVGFAGLQDAHTLGARVALEAYPGMLARECIGHVSYKSDTPAKQDVPRLLARKDIITKLETAQTRLGLRLRLSNAQRDLVTADAKGDALDALMCLVQAAWAQQQHMDGHACYGLPDTLDPLEGWIVSA
jgi:hypothetical protein